MRVACSALRPAALELTVFPSAGHTHLLRIVRSGKRSVIQKIVLIPLNSQALGLRLKEWENVPGWCFPLVSRCQMLLLISSYASQFFRSHAAHVSRLSLDTVIITVSCVGSFPALQPCAGKNEGVGQTLLAWRASNRGRLRVPRLEMAAVVLCCCSTVWGTVFCVFYFPAMKDSQNLYSKKKQKTTLQSLCPQAWFVESCGVCKFFF